MTSIFTKIIQGDSPCEKIFETDTEISFLDIMPSEVGHTLVIPKNEVKLLEDLPENQAISLMSTLQLVAKAVSNAFNRTDYNIILNNGANAGQVVEHIHFHVIPRTEGSSRPFMKNIQYATGEMQEVGTRIRNCIK